MPNGDLSNPPPGSTYSQEEWDALSADQRTLVWNTYNANQGGQTWGTGGEYPDVDEEALRNAGLNDDQIQYLRDLQAKQRSPGGLSGGLNISGPLMPGGLTDEQRKRVDRFWGGPGGGPGAGQASQYQYDPTGIGAVPQATYQPWQQGQFTTNLQRQLESRYQGLTAQERGMHRAQIGEDIGRQQAFQGQQMGQQLAQMGMSGSGMALAQQRALSSEIGREQGRRMREMELGGMQRGMQAMGMGTSLAQAMENIGMRGTELGAQVGMFNVGQQAHMQRIQEGLGAGVGMFNVEQQNQRERWLAEMENRRYLGERGYESQEDIAEGQSRSQFWGALIGGGLALGGAKLEFGCFAEDTPIKSENGNLPISEIKEGDFIKVNDDLKKVNLVLEYTNQSPTLKINDVETTEFHPFVTDGGELKLAGDLRIGDKLYGDKVVKMKEKIKSNKKLYNLEIDGHRYYVKDYLVHDGRER